MSTFQAFVIVDSEIMYIQPLPLLQIAAFQVIERLDKQQWPSDFLANELEKLPANLKDRLRTLFLRHRNLPQHVAKVNAYLPKLLHNRILDLDLGEVKLRNDLSCLASCSRLRKISLKKSLVAKDRKSDPNVLNEVLKQMVHLEVVHLQRNGDVINDETMESLSKCCPRLKELDLGHCIGITDNGIAALRYLLLTYSLNPPRQAMSSKLNPSTYVVCKCLFERG